MPYSDRPCVKPSVLVADDDAISRSFLGEALSQLGVNVALAADGGEALQLARDESFDLLILDCRMPLAGALEVLAALRQDPSAGSVGTPAIASSAELDTHEQRALLAAGFDAVLLKPCGMQELQDALALAAPQPRHLPLLDDELALRASGTPAVVQALRGLFRQELQTLCLELDDLGTDAKALEARLHKLRSSCGFCGAASLSGQIVSLQRHLRLGHRGAMLPLMDFRRALLRTSEALETP
ncbi:response regulator [Dyella jejuensis]|uniref:Response regulator n=1 Tax=Dyella jejuensis TaxID=1432009 RepID=A0ABW8JGV6_9GAMM